MTTVTAPQVAKPVLIYDGDCGFCKYWVRYWQRLTGDQVVYRPYQEAAADYPQIPVENFKGAVQYVAPDGQVASGAEASFLVLSHVPQKAYWLTLYRKLPGFAPMAEKAYGFISRRRSQAYAISRVLWGKDLVPPTYELLTNVFLRLLGIVTFSAFVSFGLQAQGLIGSHGVLPLAEYMKAAQDVYGTHIHRMIPMVFWFDNSDTAIQAVCWVGALVSLALAAGFLPRLCLFLIFTLYLSLAHAGQVFMTFQWDFLLIETAFLGLLLCVARVPGIWLLRLLSFRFIFGSGVVKIVSGDTSWRDNTALYYHFETQPLPTPLAWYAHHLPHGVLQVCSFLTLFVELALPFLIVFPRRIRFVTAVLFAVLQIIILLTGNYNFFNLLGLLMCLVLLDDQALENIRWLRDLKFLRREMPGRRPSELTAIAVGVFAVLSLLFTYEQFKAKFPGENSQEYILMSAALQPFALMNNYGPFAIMTRQRNEIILQGSTDGQTWRDYDFIYKPGDEKKPLTWSIPHQPRLDWQMWFAALDQPQNELWLFGLMHRLLQNEPSVLRLLSDNPFPDEPPRYVRAMFYAYRFTTPQEKEAAKGAVWSRTELGPYIPLVSLSDFSKP